MDELIFSVDGSIAAPAHHITLAEIGFRERDHLQEWVLRHPEILGDDVFVVTSEFDRWLSARGRERDRLDILGLDRDGYLVVAELKRDEAPETVELQALKYAAYSSRFTPETLTDHYRTWLATIGEEVDDETALERLETHLADDVGGLVNAPLGQPRIVLLAGSFAKSTTAVAVWLREMGIDVTLRTIRAYQTAAGQVVSVSQILPIAEVDDFTVSPVLADRRRDQDAKRAARRDTAVSVIIEKRVLEPGTVLIVLPAGPDAERFRTWALEAEHASCEWTGTPSRPLRWASPDASELGATGSFTVTGLVRYLYERAGAVRPSGAATQIIVTDDGRSLAELGGTGAAAFDWQPLHTLLPHIAAGKWVTYADVAATVGTAPVPLGGHVAHCSVCVNAWRILSTGGNPSAGFRWDDSTLPASPIDRLKQEGVQFRSDGSADPAQQLTRQDLVQLLESVPGP